MQRAAFGLPVPFPDNTLHLLGVEEDGKYSDGGPSAAIPLHYYDGFSIRFGARMHNYDSLYVDVHVFLNSADCIVHVKDAETFLRRFSSGAEEGFHAQIYRMLVHMAGGHDALRAQARCWDGSARSTIVWPF